MKIRITKLPNNKNLLEEGGSTHGGNFSKEDYTQLILMKVYLWV